MVSTASPGRCLVYSYVTHTGACGVHTGTPETWFCPSEVLRSYFCESVFGSMPFLVVYIIGLVKF